MRRGELYFVRKPGSGDPRKQRAFAIVSRQALIDSRLSSVICAPVYSQHDGLSTQLRLGVEGLKKDLSIHCDELVSLSKSVLTHYVGALTDRQEREPDRALAIALCLESFAFLSDEN